jgi:hypothetical protein
MKPRLPGELEMLATLLQLGLQHSQSAAAMEGVDVAAWMNLLGVRSLHEARTLGPEELRERLAQALARRLAEGWDRYGAPSAARTPEGGWVGSFEDPGGSYSVAASSKREAYRLARREWVRRLLG